MTNTTELRKRFDTEVNKWLDPMSDYGGKELVDFLISEIEQAERRRTEEIIEFLKELGKEDEGDFWDMAYSGIANDIKDKFLTKPNHE